MGAPKKRECECEAKAVDFILSLVFFFLVLLVVAFLSSVYRFWRL